MTCRTGEEEEGPFRGRGLRAGPQTFHTFILITQDTPCRADWGWLTLIFLHLDLQP